MLTLFTVPKPFSGHVGVIQKNAVQSWARLGQGCQVILCADEKGTGQLAEMVNAIHLPAVERNEFGTPLLSSVFSEVARVAEHFLLCYVNADIIVFPDLLNAIRRLPWSDFLMIGRRTNVEIREPLNFDLPDWEQRLRNWSRLNGHLAPSNGIDYMVFSRTSALRILPAFAVGRPCWDNWFVDRALRCGLPVIDATSVVLALHQNHGYEHVPQGRGRAWEGPEADANRSLVGGEARMATIDDANYYFDGDQLRRNRHLRRWLEKRMRITVPSMLRNLPRLIKRWRRKVRIGAKVCRRCPSLFWSYASGKLRSRPLSLIEALRAPREHDCVNY